ncbi:MAG: 4-(cytidine 5'-diphospho)-2-C-methyl-D-erythritol kinase [Planctomycetota bacterium]|jgi:4-diphosphocytidyl-2-C-methyl-D-erythritol kinase|nr:4-(cytidine 5'-diphospho)-2-C-methyl-D-erythritol kinase [Planctomycetota bacterium]
MTKSPQPPASRLDSGKGTAHVRLSAPAKINLYLEVLGRRDDGYHELITVLQTIDLADVVEIQIRERRPAIPAGNADISFALTGDSGALRTAATGDGQEPINAGRVPDGAENLAVRAAMAWLHAAGKQDELGIDLRLQKNIPAGAGLGGGSSDAATVLLGLDQLLGHSEAPALAPLAAGLGSDVAFFLVGGTALCTGRGENVIPLTEPEPFDLVLGFPDFTIPTPAVYGALQAPSLAGTTDSPHDLEQKWAQQLAGATLSDLEQLFRNDLEQPACSVQSELVDLLAPLDIHLSGSGSTIFLYGSDTPTTHPACRRESIRFVRHRSRKR